MTTHEVSNQAPPLVDYDLAHADPLLLGAVSEGAGWAIPKLIEFGRLLARAESYQWAADANRHPPQLRTHDRSGNRIDQVDFHPAWHQLLERAVVSGLHSLPWESTTQPGGHLARAAFAFLDNQIEAGHLCPISMTYAVVPALAHSPELAATWTPQILTRSYDPTFAPMEKKAGVLLGMGMTEKQGGSDVRAGTSRAEPATDGYRITGHKWFTSAPMNDAFLVLAQARRGLSCFLLPRHAPDGSVNEIRIMRLKDKLGNRSNASAELEFEGAFAQLVGEEGRGVNTIIEMVNGTRLDCIIGSAAQMRQAVSQAIHHCRHRRAFGSPLIDKPAMINVLADLEIETEAAVLLMARVALSFDRADDEREQSLRRLITPLAKFLVTKRCTEVVHEALECLGGNGYVEESVMPRLLRESPLNAIWEGSGNVIALDVLRAARTHPESVTALKEEVSGIDARIDAAADSAFALLEGLEDPEGQARLVTERLGALLQAALLTKSADPAVTHAFISTRLEGAGGRFYGTLPHPNGLATIVERAIPA
ncbi:MAG: acyl-CoA dehydrogenase family protein [Acidimicrobiia bacterium]